MTRLLYFLVLINAVVSFAAAGAVWWRNRYQILGPLFGVTLSLMGAWTVGFAHYYYPLMGARALLAAYWTLTFSIAVHAAWFHTLCALAEKQRRMRWWLIGSYVTALLFVILLWNDRLITGLRSVPYMEHYVRYDRHLYPWLMAYMLTWQFLGVGLVFNAIRQQIGYRRSQLTYFLAAWFIIFLTTSSIIIPLGYDVNIPPFGFFVLPLNLLFLAYVMAKARLADYNVVIMRVLLHSVTLVVVVAVSLLFIGAMALVAPGFMNQQQILFTILLVVVVGLALAFLLPRWLPRAERLVQERLFTKRSGYQAALTGLVQQLSHLGTVDEVLDIVVNTLHGQMQVSRAVILLQDPLSGRYRLRAQSGLPAAEVEAAPEWAETSRVIEWLRTRRDVLVREELQRREDEATRQALVAELAQFQVAVCVPMILDGKVTGVLGLGDKATRAMFFISDLRVLQTLVTEVALAVKYRKMEEEIFRKNKLIELGTLAAGVAHEIRNPLASIRTFAQLLPEKIDDPEFKNEFSKLVLKDVDRITKVIESMLAFARPSQVMAAAIGVTDLVDEAVLLAQPRVKAKRIELSKQFHEQPTVLANKQQILQVLINLINNAADALPEQGKIQIATGVRWMEPSERGEKRRQCGVIEVTDNGLGIPAAIRGRLFDPFFTTKKEGTGLGLSISQKIVRDHGGIITVSSIEGKGSTFQVCIPIIERQVSTQEKAA